MIYLDNAATTYPKPKKVYEALDFANRHLSFNAGRGAYKEANECLRVLDELRKEIADVLHCNSNNVSLLSSATEALNLIINGIDFKDGTNVYITPFEHNAVVRPLYNIQKTINIKIHILPFNKDSWEPDVAKIKNMFALNNPDVVFSSQISNVTGLLIDYQTIFEMSKAYNAINILDAAQGYGIVDINKTNIDYIVFAGHKSLYGPFGIGGFINLSNNELRVTKSGGTGSDTLNHEMPEKNHYRYESGSPNVPAAYGVLSGIKWIKENNIFEHEKELTEYLINSLESVEKIHVFRPNQIDKIFGIISISVDGYSADEIGNILNDEYDICVRTGYHCSPFVHEFINSTSNGGTARISISRFTTKEDVDAVISALKTL